MQLPSLFNRGFRTTLSEEEKSGASDRSNAGTPSTTTARRALSPNDSISLKSQNLPDRARKPSLLPAAPHTRSRTPSRLLQPPGAPQTRRSPVEESVGRHYRDDDIYAECSEGKVPESDRSDSRGRNFTALRRSRADAQIGARRQQREAVTVQVAPTATLITPFDRETMIFRQKQKVRHREVDRALQPIQKTGLRLQEKFFDGRRMPIESLTLQLSSYNIECSPNNAHQSLSFITAMLSMVSGVHGKKDLPEATRALFEQDHDVHHAEANYLLQKINALHAGLAHRPIGSIGPDATEAEKEIEKSRIQSLFTMLDKTYKTNFTVRILDMAFEDTQEFGSVAILKPTGKFQNALAPTMRNGKISTGYIVHDRDTGRFLPLRMQDQRTNAFLAPSSRYNKKSLTGKVRSTLSNLRSKMCFSTRIKAIRLADADLYEKAVDKASGRPRIMGRNSRENEYIKEWLKRTDVDYERGKKTRLKARLYQRPELGSTAGIPVKNPYLKESYSTLVERRDDIEHPPGRKQKKLIKEAIYRNRLLKKGPAASNPLPPTPVAIAPAAEFKSVMAQFDLLLQSDGDAGGSSFPGKDFERFRLLANNARANVAKGFKSGDKTAVIRGHKLFQEALKEYDDRARGAQHARSTSQRMASRNERTLQMIFALQESLADLAQSRPLPYYRRTAEMADVLRICGCPPEDVQKFSDSIAPIMAQQRQAREGLQRFLYTDARQRASLSRPVAQITDTALIDATEKALKELESKLEDAQNIIQETQKQIVACNRDIERYNNEIEAMDHANAPADIRTSSVVHPATGPVLSATVAAMSVHDRARLLRRIVESEARAERLEQELEIQKDAADALEEIADASAGERVDAARQARKLGELAEPWAAINAIWRTCESFNRTATPQRVHPVDLAGPELHRQMTILRGYQRAQAG